MCPTVTCSAVVHPVPLKSKTLWKHLFFLLWPVSSCGFAPQSYPAGFLPSQIVHIVKSSNSLLKIVFSCENQGCNNWVWARSRVQCGDVFLVMVGLSLLQRVSPITVFVTVSIESSGVFFFSFSCPAWNHRPACRQSSSSQCDLGHGTDETTLKLLFTTHLKDHSSL